MPVPLPNHIVSRMHRLPGTLLVVYRYQILSLSIERVERKHDRLHFFRHRCVPGTSTCLSNQRSPIPPHKIPSRLFWNDKQVQRPKNLKMKPPSPFHVSLLSVLAFLSSVFSTRTRAQPLDLPNHPYIPPVDVLQNRGPCPALNTLANHGYIARDGKNISRHEMATAGELVYGLAYGNSVTLFNGAVGRGVPTTGGTSNGKNGVEPTMDLSALYLHNAVEHDGSLFRRDAFFQDPAPIDESLYDELVEFVNGRPVITLKELMDFSKLRMLDSRIHNPEATFPSRTRLIMAGERTIALLMGGAETIRDQTLRMDYIYSFFIQERIPEDFVITRQSKKGGQVSVQRNIDIVLRNLRALDTVPEQCPAYACTSTGLLGTRLGTTLHKESNRWWLLWWGGDDKSECRSECITSEAKVKNQLRLGWECGPCE